VKLAGLPHHLCRPRRHAAPRHVLAGHGPRPSAS